MANKNKANLTYAPVGKTLIDLTIPMIFGALGLVVFNLVDTFFVGRLGTNELAALSFTFPVVLVLNNIALGVGVGAGAVISRAIGEGDYHNVKRLTTDSLSLALVTVIIFVAIGMLTIEPIFRLLGANPKILPLVKQYMRIWYPGMLFVMFPMVGNNAIRAAGDTKTPAIIMIVAATVNTILDPLLIFGIGPFPRLEIAGAALATIISRAITMAVAIYVLWHREKMITLERPAAREVLRSWGQILYIGIPTAGTRIIIPLAVGVITSIVARFGPVVVAAYGVASRIEFFSMTVVRALSAVLAPFVGQNIGAGKYDRVQTGIKYSSRFSALWGIFLLGILAIFARPIASVFNKNPEVVSNIALYLRIVPVGYGLQGVLLLAAATLNVLNKPFHAAVLSIIQMFVLCVPLAYLGARLFGVGGVFAAISISYIVAGALSYTVLMKIMKNYV
ncbi:MATE family efflux transporter [bacterium]|nr:MATE family efflux transporter [bacterium]